MKYVNFPWPPVEAALSIFNVSFLVKVFFLEGCSANKGDSHQYRITSLLKMSVSKRSVR